MRQHSDTLFEDATSFESHTVKLMIFSFLKHKFFLSQLATHIVVLPVGPTFTCFTINFEITNAWFYKNLISLIHHWFETLQ